MAEYRNTRTDTWRDDWFMELTPQEKLAFFYLFTNESTNLAGIYKLSYRHMQLETGLDADTLNAALQRFVDDRKVVIGDGYIWVVNLRKYNASRSPKADAAIESILKQIPDCDIKRAYIACYTQNIPYTYPIDTTLPIQHNTEQYNNNSIQGGGGSADRPLIFELYESQIGNLTGMIAEDLKQAEIDYPKDWIEAAFREAARNNAHSWNYVHAILKRWKAAGAIDIGSKPSNGKYKGKQSLEDRNREVTAQVQREIDNGTFSKY
jgi:DnaD/phage-associated family protein